MAAAPTFPIVLAHGIARFDQLTNRLFKIDNDSDDDGWHYFRNIRNHLQAHGFIVRHSNVQWAAGVKARSATLRRNIHAVLKELRAEQVHIIAHSMGGLDARQMLFDGRGEGFHKKVASLTTLTTPHHGSPAADALAKDVARAVGLLGIDASGLHDLTTAACRKFNEEKRDWERTCGVTFQAYACAQPWRRIFAPLKLTWRMIEPVEGDNDGLVSVRSARWADEYFRPPVIDADHLNILGWWDAAELWRPDKAFGLVSRIKALYLAIAQDLAQRFPTCPCGRESPSGP